MPALKALISQLGSLALLYVIGHSGALPALSPLGLAALQAVLAAFFAYSLRSAGWWIAIHLLFMPCVVITFQGDIPAWLYLLAFVGLSLVYWSSFRTQVPLFLSSKIAVHRLAAWLPDTTAIRVLDIGSGTGSMVRRLARLRPDWSVQGIETAPAPYWLSRYLSRHLNNAALLRGDFWQRSLRDFDVVYAFLSPVPMSALWSKAVREMRPGSLLISNTFAIGQVKPEHVIAVDDHRQSQLYCYRIPGAKQLNTHV
ncbi:class I SAM-dependent methyltransferase [Uliginosibacterium sediminicola]|uniref:Class I SAM-dependent methyltransferase n=1 Tax=Uliginosibacterium sediminicola TaxID=2024550 RepID=A0ABU9Z3Z4_9RHOO